MTTYSEITNFDAKSNLTLVGVTDEVTQCSCCGKSNLKRTAVLQDEWGQFSFYGTTCAYKALNIWNKPGFIQDHIKRAAKAKTSIEVIHTELNGVQYVLTKYREDPMVYYRTSTDKWHGGRIENFAADLRTEFYKKGTLTHVPYIKSIADYLDKYSRDGFPF